MILALIALISTQNPVRAFSGPVTGLAFDSSGTLYATGEGGVAKIAKNGVVESKYKTRFPKATGIVLSPDGAWMAVCGGDPAVSGWVEILDSASGSSLTSLETGTDLCMGIALSGDGEALAAAGADGVVKILRFVPKPPSLKMTAELTGHSGPVLAVGFLPTGALLSAGTDGTLRLWNAKSRRVERSLSFHTGPIHGIAVPLLIDGTPWCVTASGDKTVRIWHPEIGRMVRILRGAEGPILAVAATPGGDGLLTAGSEGIVRLISVDGGDPLATWAAPGVWIHSLAVAPTGGRAAFGMSDGNIQMIDLSRSSPQPLP